MTKGAAMSTTTPSTEVRVNLSPRPQRAPAPRPGGDRPTTGGRLDLAGKLFQASLWPGVQAVANGDTLAAPLVVELDPTSFCDMRCPECISIELLNDARFPRERLLSLAKEFADLGVRAVILIGGGEPLMHNAIGDAIDILGAAGIAVGLTTNGTMIDRYLAPIAAFGAWTRVSVDAGTAETFERFRPHRTGRNAFDQVIGNMRRLAAVKTGSLGYSFLLVARTTAAGDVVESNFGDVAAAAALARDIGCDYFEVKPTYDLAHFLVAQPPALGELLADQLHRAHETAGDGFEVLSPRTLSTVMDERQYVEPKDYHHCPVAELRTLVTATGAYVCPYHRGNPRARYGNPLAETFAEMWSGQRRHEVKTGIDPAADCRFHCIRHQSNVLLLRMAHEDLSSEVVPDHDPFL
jgi:MoaA/NifB/PqqE/SkfB family radical SAM enzyme